MEISEVQFGDILSELIDVVKAHAMIVALTIVLIAAAHWAIDLLPNKTASVFPGLIINIVGQYRFVEALMPEYTASPTRHYGSMFAASFLGGLGVLFGTLVLILPGLYLAARWMIATPLIVTQGLGGREALKASWHATEAARWPIFWVVLVGIAVLIALFLALGAISGLLQLPQNSLADSAAIQTLTSIWIVGSWCLGVAIFRRLAPASGKYEEVFA